MHGVFMFFKIFVGLPAGKTNTFGNKMENA